MIYNKDAALKVAEFLLQIKAIKLEIKQPFQWASGWRSPIYCDNRLILSHPTIRTYIRQAFVEVIDKQYEKIDCIAGVATGGIAQGALVAQDMGLPFAYVRPKAKAHGMQNQIEGHIESGSSVIVIEDLISTGGSSLGAVQALREAGCNVKGLLAIFSYGFEVAKKNFKKADCPLYVLSDYNHLLQKAVEINYISESDVLTLEDWRTNPQEWGK